MMGVAAVTEMTMKEKFRLAMGWSRYCQLAGVIHVE
jgi:hypothetical protein